MTADKERRGRQAVKQPGFSLAAVNSTLIVKMPSAFIGVYRRIIFWLR
jgi:hypothetical protein